MVIQCVAVDLLFCPAKGRLAMLMLVLTACGKMRAALFNDGDSFMNKSVL